MLVLPVHNAVLVECDLGEVDEVAKALVTIMTGAVRAYYPELRPRVDVNRADVTCWNKDGKSNSLEKFLEDPMYKL